MIDRRLRLGVCLGLVIGLCSAAPNYLSQGQGAAVSGIILSDCDGALQTLVIHHLSEAAPITERVYQALLPTLPAGVVVHVVCPGPDDFEDLKARVGETDCTLVPTYTRHPITCWSRDRWLCLKRGGGERRLLLYGREESAAAIWPARDGDHRVARDLARAFPDRLEAHCSVLRFDGGDFVADNTTVFVTPRVAQQNVGRAVPSAAALCAQLEQALGRRVVLLKAAPPHHAGMFMMLVGKHTAIVGDPGLAQSLLRGSAEFGIEHPDFSAATQAAFDAVARRCEHEGYRIVRMPVVPGRDGRTYVTYVNAILDQRQDGRVVYMPTYRGCERLNEAAAEVWQGLGYRVQTIDCTDAYPHFGSLRCLVNVLERDPVGSEARDELEK